MGKKWIWDLLASKDPMYAAISVSTEEQERIKTIPQIELILSFISDGTVLDAGCGYGRIAKYLLPRKNFDAYIGIDLSEVMLQRFLNLSQKFKGSTPIYLIRSPLESIPLKSESCDNIITIAVLLHCSRKSVHRIINEFYRILKPGGRLIALVSFPNIYTFSGFQGLCYEALLAALGKASINGPVRYWTKSSIVKMFVNFSQVKILYNGFNLIPKSILGLPEPINRIYRQLIHDKLSPFLYTLLPDRLRKLFCMHYDILAIK
jgi:SAM-dependent methyltransferase